MDAIKISTPYEDPRGKMRNSGDTEFVFSVRQGDYIENTRAWSEDIMPKFEQAVEKFAGAEALEHVKELGVDLVHVITVGRDRAVDFVMKAS